MTKLEYTKLLKDPKWKSKRLEILERDNNTCSGCGKTDNLQVHHLIYEDAPPWESRNEDLITLCKLCHKEWHNKHKPGNRNYFIGFASNFTYDDDRQSVAKTKIITSKKLVDVLKEEFKDDNDDSLIGTAVNKLILDIYNLSVIQNKGTFKITTKVTGDIEANISLIVSYKDISIGDRYTKLKQKYPNEISFSGKTLIFDPNISNKRMNEIRSDFIKMK